MHRRNHVRARILREMLQGLPGDQPGLLAAPPVDPVPQENQEEIASHTRWWRVGRFFRRQEPAHTEPRVLGKSNVRARN